MDLSTNMPPESNLPPSRSPEAGELLLRDARLARSSERRFRVNPDPDARRVRWARCALLVGSMFGAILIAELGARAINFAVGDGPPYGDRSVRREWQWARAHLDAGTASLDGYARHHPKLGWALRPGLHLQALNTNSMGMRGLHEFPLMHADQLRVLFVGDSYTFGWGVADDEAFPAVLAELAPEWEIMNLGVPGYGADQALLMYEELGRHYHPDVVVLGFFVRGFDRVLGRFRSYAKPWFTLDRRNVLRLHGVPVPAPEQLYQTYRSGRRRVGDGIYSYFFGELSEVREKLHSFMPVNRDDREWKLMSAILRRFRDRVSEEGASPLLLIIPTRKNAGAERNYERIADLAKQEAEAMGMPCLSLADGLADVPDEVLFRSDKEGGHMSPAGNRLAAEHLRRRLREGRM